MSKKQLTIRYNAETYKQFIAANPDLEDLSVGNLLDHLMRLYPHLTTEIELQNALINAISAQPEQAHQQAQETADARITNAERPATAEQRTQNDTSIDDDDDDDDEWEPEAY